MMAAVAGIEARFVPAHQSVTNLGVVLGLASSEA